MGIRQRLMRWLARGEVDLVDPRTEVEIAEVMLHEGPMLVSALERAGVPARGVEAWNLVAKTTNRMRILVRVVDEAKATEKWSEVQRLQFEEGGYLVYANQTYVDGLAKEVNGLEPSKSAWLSGFELHNAWLS